MNPTKIIEEIFFDWGKLLDWGGAVGWGSGLKKKNRVAYTVSKFDGGDTFLIFMEYVLLFLNLFYAACDNPVLDLSWGCTSTQFKFLKA